MKAIEKAIARGWKPESSNYKPGILINPRVSGNHDDTLGAAWSIENRWDVIWMSYRDIIYNHDFAKALWGDRFITPEMRDDKGSRVIAIQQTAWRHHLRQMVVADDPIAYLGQNI